jgi:hypothetical protein
MIYKFKSKATGDLVMLGPNGDQMLRLLGREPEPKGIVEVEQLAPAIAALRAAVRDARRIASSPLRGLRFVARRHTPTPGQRPAMRTAAACLRGPRGNASPSTIRWCG